MYTPFFNYSLNGEGKYIMNEINKFSRLVQRMVYCRVCSILTEKEGERVLMQTLSRDQQVNELTSCSASYMYHDTLLRVHEKFGT